MTDYQPYYADSYALVIGINTYSDAHFVPLGEAEADALDFANLLGDNRFGFKVKMLLGAAATRATILEQLHRLTNANPDDRILVYFAGHGYTLADRFGAETGYLACYDTAADKHYTALELEEVLDLRRHSPAKHIAFVFDACFSGQALGLTRAAPTTAERFLTRRAYQVISAGAGDQTVADYDSMTDVLIERLDQDGVSTVNSLGLYVQRVMSGRSGNMQIPQFGSLAGSQGGDFIFEARADPENVPEIDPDDVTAVLPITRRPGGGTTTTTNTTLTQYGPLIGVSFIVIALVVLLAGLGVFSPPVDPTPTTTVETGPQIIYTNQSAQEPLVPRVEAIVERYDEEFRFALQNTDLTYIGSTATGQALEDRQRALDILEEAGNCRWEYDHRGLRVDVIQFLSSTRAQVTATVDRDGTVFCEDPDSPTGETEFDQYAFEGPFRQRYDVQLIDQRWFVTDTESITE